MPFRGFVAVEVGARPPLVALLEALQGAGADLKVVAPENLHVTLKFLGPTPDESVPAVERTMRAAVAGEAPFALRVRGTGAFPPRGAPRVLWAGLEGAEPLARVAGRLEDALAELGWARERRPFAPHLTLARARSPRGAERALAALERAGRGLDEAVAVDRVRLMRSTLGPAGPAYDAVLEVPLEA